ncbi:MAG: hypothetical protein E7K14_01675 [Bacillota bacterium]|nr:hypothetical protein [Bacillota bacterium]
MRDSLKFSVNGRYTTIVEDGHLFDGIELILKRYPWVDYGWLTEQTRFLGEDRMVAVVQCHEDDEYDCNKGKEAAMKKLNRKIMVQRESLVSQFEAYIRVQMASPATKNKDYKK